MSAHFGAALRRELGEDLAALAALSEDECEQLLGLIRRAKSNQQRDLSAAIASTLDHLPRLLRIPARKILFD